MTTLLLTLSREPFEVMASGEKTEEIRRPSDWILSRLIGKKYDLVKFLNGYGPDKPFFVCQYFGYCFAKDPETRLFSNGLVVPVTVGDVRIFLGEIIEGGNYDQNK